MTTWKLLLKQLGQAEKGKGAWGSETSLKQVHRTFGGKKAAAQSWVRVPLRVKVSPGNRASEQAKKAETGWRQIRHSPAQEPEPLPWQDRPNIRRQELLTSASQQHTTSLMPERAEQACQRERQTSDTDILHKVGMTAYTCSHSTWRLRQTDTEFQASLSSMVRPCLK